jgi:hypothetical protein
MALINPYTLRSADTLDVTFGAVRVEIRVDKIENNVVTLSAYTHPSVSDDVGVLQTEVADLRDRLRKIHIESDIGSGL